MCGREFAEQNDDIEVANSKTTFDIVFFRRAVPRQISEMRMSLHPELSKFRCVLAQECPNTADLVLA